MPASKLKFFKRCAEFLPKEEIKNIPDNTRGIYVLSQVTKGKKYNVVYVGMARGDKTGIKSRILVHSRSKTKRSFWSHFSLFEVHDNVSKEEIEELEGMLRHIYRFDLEANPFNQQRRYKKLIAIRNKNMKLWDKTSNHSKSVREKNK